MLLQYTVSALHSMVALVFHYSMIPSWYLQLDTPTLFLVSKQFMAKSTLSPVACWLMTYFAPFDYTTCSPSFKKQHKKTPPHLPYISKTSLPSCWTRTGLKCRKIWEIMLILQLLDVWISSVSLNINKNWCLQVCLLSWRTLHWNFMSYFFLPTEGNGEKYKYNPVLGWHPNSIGNYALVMFPRVKTLFHIYTTKCSL